MGRIDVVIPCYNYGRFLRQCVNSVLDQAGAHVRILIIDDASPDNTAEVAADLASKDQRVIVTRHTTNMGHILTYNEGIEWASADYMLLLSADDYLLPGALRRAAELMDAHPEVGFTFGNVIELSDDGSETALESLIRPTTDRNKRILQGRELIELTGAEGNQVVTCSAVVRTKLQRSLGGYREELPHAGDLEMWLRFAAHASAGFIFASQGVYRRHSASMSGAYYLRSAGGNVFKANGRLADLKQQKIAFDFFSQYCQSTMPGSKHICDRLYQQLSKHIINHASAAFNNGEMQESRQLSDFALTVCPDVKRSSEWVKLTCKRGMGRGAWRALGPAVAAIRAMQRH